MNFQDEIEVVCPYCGERFTLLVDTSAGAQEYVEDCQVCCRPMQVGVEPREDLEPVVTIRREDE